MSKRSSVVSALMSGLLVTAGEAMAACSGTPLTQTQLTSTLTSNTVCATRSSESWQELHQSGGALVDFKRGPGDPVDPSETVGSWSIRGTSAVATVFYDYGSGGNFTYQVYANGGNSYSFCVGSTDLPVTIKPGGGACP